MRNPFAAPRTIRRIAARRVFQVAGRRRDVVLTLGVPVPVPGSDWGCALQITGLDTEWRRPRYVFGIDALQALHLAMQCATTVLESSPIELELFGQKELGLPRFLPEVPKRQRDRIDAYIERQITQWVAALERRHQRKTARRAIRGRSSK